MKVEGPCLEIRARAGLPGSDLPLADVPGLRPHPSCARRPIHVASVCPQQTMSRACASVPEEIAEDHVAGEEQVGVEVANRVLHGVRKEEGLMQIRLRLLELRQSYLNQVNTQAALVGSCAVGLLASGELSVLTELTVCRESDHDPDHIALKVCKAIDGLVNCWYLVSAVGCFATSLWVIYYAMNLVNLTTMVTLHATGAQVHHTPPRRIFFARAADILCAGRARRDRQIHQFPHGARAKNLYALAGLPRCAHPPPQAAAPLLQCGERSAAWQ